MIREDDDWQPARPRGLPRGFVPAPRIAEPSELMRELTRARERRDERRRAQAKQITQVLAQPVESPPSESEYRRFIRSLIEQHGIDRVRGLLQRHCPTFELPKEKKEP